MTVYEVVRAIRPPWADTYLVHIQSPHDNSQMVMWPIRLHPLEGDDA